MNIEVEKVFTERGFTNIEQMTTMFDWYKEEVDRLNNNINKAIEYLENTYYWNLDNQELLDILRGEDDEN